MKRLLPITFAVLLGLNGGACGTSTEADPSAADTGRGDAQGRDAGAPPTDASRDAEMRDSNKAESVRFMTYNIAFGRISDLASVATLIAEANPDIACLQEVDAFQPRSGNIDQIAELGAMLPDLPYHRYVPSLAEGEPAVGNAVLSRWPIRASQELAFEFRRTGAPQRFALFADIEVSESAAPFMLTAICTHLNGGNRPEANEERIAHFQEIEAQEARPRMVLGGDFNHTDARLSYAYSLENWVDTQSVVIPPEPPEGGHTIGYYPKGDKRDFIYLRNQDEWDIAQVVIIDDVVTSDHRAVYADLIPTPDGYSSRGDAHSMIRQALP